MKGVMLLMLALGAAQCGSDAGSGKVCGGFAGTTCDTGEYCAYEGQGMCGAADGSAFCKTRPAVCSSIADPVCGCDGTTYASACIAAMAGFGYSAKGACP